MSFKVEGGSSYGQNKLTQFAHVVPRETLLSSFSPVNMIKNFVQKIGNSGYNPINQINNNQPGYNKLRFGAKEDVYDWKRALSNLYSYLEFLPKLDGFKFSSGNSGYSIIRHIHAYVSGIEQRFVVPKLLWRVNGSAGRVLDLGSGVGNNLPDIRDRFPFATIVEGDISPSALEIASRVYTKEPKIASSSDKRQIVRNVIEHNKRYFPNFMRHYKKMKDVEFKQLDATCIDLPDNSVDVVVMTETIEHIDPRLRPHVFKEIERVLIPGGFFIATMPNYSRSMLGLIKKRADLETRVPIWNAGHSHYKNRGAEYHVKAIKIEEEVKEAGFKMALVRGYNYLLAFFPTFITPYHLDGSIPQSVRLFMQTHSGYDGIGSTKGFRHGLGSFAFIAIKKKKKKIDEAGSAIHPSEESPSV
jgi:SAM-dependent methyltransferase